MTLELTQYGPRDSGPWHRVIEPFDPLKHHLNEPGGDVASMPVDEFQQNRLKETPDDGTEHIVQLS